MFITYNWKNECDAECTLKVWIFNLYLFHTIINIVAIIFIRNFVWACRQSKWMDRMSASLTISYPLSIYSLIYPYLPLSSLFLHFFLPLPTPTLLFFDCFWVHCHACSYMLESVQYQTVEWTIHKWKEKTNNRPIGIIYCQSWTF